jgi:D-serine deaminase-like pyridoxal phosphate-dependent protein
MQSLRSDADKDPVEGSPLEEVGTPALVVDLDRFEANVAAAADLTRGTGTVLRPHVKAHRTPGLALRQLGPEAPGVTCATVGEAEAMVDAGIDDVLLANEFVNSALLARIARLAGRARMTVAVDSHDGVVALASAAAAAGTTVGALVDLEVGLERCGVPDAPAARDLATAVARERGLRFAGLMGYEGRFPTPDPDRSATRRAYDLLAEAKETLEGAGLPVETVSSAGTSTLLEAVAHPVVTEAQAGTYAFMEPDLLGLGLPFRPALRVLASVISRSGTRVVLGAGKKSFSCDRGLPVMETEGVQVLGTHEEHTVLHWEGDPPDLGSSVALIPSHVPLTFNLHDMVWLARGDRIEDRLPISARGRSG